VFLEIGDYYSIEISNEQLLVGCLRLF